jgi:hypothetical protein
MSLVPQRISTTVGHILCICVISMNTNYVPCNGLVINLEISLLVIVMWYRVLCQCMSPLTRGRIPDAFHLEARDNPEAVDVSLKYSLKDLEPQVLLAGSTPIGK